MYNEQYENLEDNLPQCFETHPPLNINIDNKPTLIWGSSCFSPIVNDANIYISLDPSAPVYDWEQPWYEHTGLMHIRFPIEDMSYPLNLQEFNYCLQYVSELLALGNKVHVGCIGGHGRTGLFLAALCQKNMAEQLQDNGTNAIDYVRQNYCIKAIETIPQILFLHYQFDVDIPTSQKKEISKFKDIFEREVGLSLETTIEQGMKFDDLHHIIMEIDCIYEKEKKISKINKKRGI